MNNKIKLTFEEMQEFINFVVSNTIKYGEGYRSVLTAYCTVKYYGNKQVVEGKSVPIVFKTKLTADNFLEDIAKIYDDEYDTLFGGVSNIDTKQFEDIIKSLDCEITKLEKYYAASMVMSETNESISKFVNSLTLFVNKLNDVADQIPNNSFETEDVKKAINALANMNGNIDSDSFVKAMVDNGIVSVKDKAVKNGKNKSVGKNKPNIEVTSNKRSGD